MRCRAWLAGVAVVTGGAPAGCTLWPRDAEPRSTRLTAADLAEAADAVTEQLARSELLAGRNSASPPMRLVLRQLQNLSSDRIPVPEQWVAVSRVLADAGMQELLRARNVVVQLPSERVELLRGAGVAFPDLRPEDHPTHELRAEIRSATRAGSTLGDGRADVRKDVYQLAYSILDLTTREIAWEGAGEVAREAFGLTID